MSKQNIQTPGRQIIDRIKNRVVIAQGELYELKVKVREKEAAIFALNKALQDAETVEQRAKTDATD